MGDKVTGKAAAQAVVDKLKAEQEEKEEQDLAVKEEVKTQLESLRQNPALHELYKKHSKLGAENLSGSIPYLRIHTANSMNELADGSRPKDGEYFYAPTKEAFEKVTCHILNISRGFKVKQVDKDTGRERLQYNQLVAGVIVNGGRLLPFFMYVNGLKLRPLWDFGKEMSYFTDSGYPMFSIVIEMTTEEFKTEEYGYKRVPKFKIVKDENGNPDIILDVETFNVFLRAAEQAKVRSDQIIASIEAHDDKEIITGVETNGETVAEDEQGEPDEVQEPAQVVDPEDIPF